MCVGTGEHFSFVGREEAQTALLALAQRAPSLDARGLQGVEEVLRFEGQIGPVHARRISIPPQVPFRFAAEATANG